MATFASGTYEMPPALAAALPAGPKLHLDWPSKTAAEKEGPLLHSEVFTADTYFALGARLPAYGAVVVDVGACVGQFALRCSLASKVAHVVAIEPAPATTACLLRNLARALRRRTTGGADVASAVEGPAGELADEDESSEAAEAAAASGMSLLHVEMWDHYVVPVARTSRYTVIAAAVGRAPQHQANLEYDSRTPGEATLFPAERRRNRRELKRQAEYWLQAVNGLINARVPRAAWGAAALAEEVAMQAAAQVGAAATAATVAHLAAGNGTGGGGNRTRVAQSEGGSKTPGEGNQGKRRTPSSDDAVPAAPPSSSQSDTLLQSNQPPTAVFGQLLGLLLANPGLKKEELQVALTAGLEQLRLEEEAEENSSPDRREKRPKLVNNEVIAVPRISLSQAVRNLRLRQIDILKVDCEGAELEVLKGMTRSTWTMVDQIVAEVADVDGRLQVSQTPLVISGRGGAARGTLKWEAGASDKLLGDVQMYYSFIQVFSATLHNLNPHALSSTLPPPLRPLLAAYDYLPTPKGIRDTLARAWLCLQDHAARSKHHRWFLQLYASGAQAVLCLRQQTRLISGPALCSFALLLHADLRPTLVIQTRLSWRVWRQASCAR
jgi:FkbM family methyltransferase